MVYGMLWLFVSYLLCADKILIHGKLAKRSTASPRRNSTLPTTLTVCFIWEDDSYYSVVPRVAPAVDLGAAHANNFVLSKDLTLRVQYQSSGNSCTRTQFSVVSNLFDLFQKSNSSCNIFVGASCPYTAAALYGFSRSMNIPLFACPAAGAFALQMDSTRDDFDLVVQPAYGYNDFSAFLTGFLEQNVYTHISIFRDDSYSLYAVWADSYLRYLRDKSPTIYINTVSTTVRSRRTTMLTYKQLLQAANDRSRVMILFVHAKGVRDIMLAAQELGYTTGDHVYFAMELFELDYWGTIDPTLDDKNDTAAVNAFRSLLVISFFEARGPHKNDLDDAIKSLAREKYNFTYNPLEKVDMVVISNYEAVLIYATVVNDLFQSGLDYTDGDLVVTQTANATFVSPSGERIFMGPDRQRENNYCMKKFDAVRDEFQIFVQFLPHADSNETYRHVKDLNWPSSNGHLPADEPRCGFRNDKCRNDGLSSGAIAGVVVTLLIVIAALAAGVGFFYLRFSKFQLDPNWWKIYTEDLDIKSPATGTNTGSKTSASKKTLQSHATGTTGYSGYVCELFASYKGLLVGLTDVRPQNKIPNKELVNQVNAVRLMEHVNIQKFVGIAVNSSGACDYIVGELCPKGSLADVLENPMIKLDWFFKNSFIRDIVNGLTYLHASPVNSHGNMSSHACLIDARFTLKISDYGLPFFRLPADLLPPRPSDTERQFDLLLWRAPELLRQVMPAKGTQKGDVYSFAILLQQIILRSGPFELPDDPLELSAREIIQEVIAANIPPVRPRVPRSSCSNELYDLMERCWEEVPIERPTFPKIKDRLRKVIGNIGDNIVDLLLRRMEQYAADLEQKVAEQTQQFMDEKIRSEQLLSQMLPKTVAAALTKGSTVDPEAFECVTIFFSDIVGFTTIASREKPMKVIDLLNSLYTFFDIVLEKYNVYKVETIGDSYMVASGLPLRNGNRHVTEISCMALDLIHGIAKFAVPDRPTEHIQVREGINSGPCVAGIVGTKMPRYCLFGDTVNVASRMESTGESMKIQISFETKALLDEIGNFMTAQRGEVSVKGKGVLTTFWLLGKTER